ncbi:MAG: hypothetical protein RIQ81_1924 [Pseudomonadota bacterium]
MLTIKRTTFAVLFLLAFSGCQVRRVINGRTDANRSAAEAPSGLDEAIAAGVPVKGGQGPGGSTEGRPAICAELEKPCAGGENATFCSLKAIPGVNFNEPSRIYAHAKSECEARNQVLASACKRGIDIKALNAISCEADKSEGKCPVEAGICITLYDPHKCVAAKFGDQALAGDALIVGWGGNSCVARGDMRRFACSRNINPERLADVSCDRMASFQGDCPPVQPGCDVADKVATACEVTPPGGEKLTSDAEGACLARFKLDWQLCLGGHSPAALVNQIKCAKK